MTTTRDPGQSLAEFLGQFDEALLVMERRFRSLNPELIQLGDDPPRCEALTSDESLCWNKAKDGPDGIGTRFCRTHQKHQKKVALFGAET